MVLRWLKTLLILLLSCSLLLLMLFWLISSSEKVPKNRISSADMATSKLVMAQTLAQLRSNSGRIELAFEQQQLDALMNVASQALPHAHFTSVISPYGLVISAQAQVLSTGRSIRVGCLLLNEGDQFAISYCRLGKLPLPGILTNRLLKYAVKKTVAAPADEQLLRLFASGQLTDNKLLFIDENTSPIDLNLQTALDTPAVLPGPPVVLAPDITFYLNQLKQLQHRYPDERRLAFFVQKLLNTAQQRQTDNSRDTQYYDASWALIVAFGNRRFIHYANAVIPLNQVPRFSAVLLRGRRDLALHFLYSAAVKLLSSARLSAQIGNFKEIYDAGNGSGFSFADLAADYAGIYFAENIQQINPALLQTLSVTEFEAAFMPGVADLPEGLSEQQVQQRFGGYQGQQFKKTEQIIINRLQELTLYKK